MVEDEIWAWLPSPLPQPPLLLVRSLCSETESADLRGVHANDTIRLDWSRSTGTVNAAAASLQSCPRNLYGYEYVKYVEDPRTMHIRSHSIAALREFRIARPMPVLIPFLPRARKSSSQSD